MGGLCTPKPQVTATNQTQTYTPAPQVGAAGTQALNMAQGAAQQPFQMPAAPVAGFNPFQTQSFNQILGMQGGLNATAGANLQTAQAPITQDDINQNMNPYADQTEADIKKYIFDPQRVQQMGQDTAMAGGVGADRLALTSQNLDKTQGDILAQARSGFYGQALSAAQQAKQQALQSAQGWQNLQTGNLQATNALGMVGTQQQQQTQAELMSPYQQILAQIAYPYQQAQFLAGITGGLAGAMGGTTTGAGNTSTTPAQPSVFNQAVGLGAAGVGAYGALSGAGSGATSTPNSPSASMYTGDPSQAGFGPTYYRSGGPVHYASGGSDDEAPSLSPYGDLNPIPRLPLHMTSGQSHNNLNLNPPSQSGSPSSSSGIGDAAKLASAVIPFLLKRGGTVAGGGAVSPYDYGRGFAEGGETEGLSPIPYIPMQDTSGQSHNNLNLNPPTSSGGSSSSGMGDMAKMASAVLPLLMMKRGGKAPHGYATDGGVDVEEYSPDDFNPIDAAAPAEPDYSRPIEREAPNLGMWPFNRGQADYKGDVTMFPHTAAPATAGAAQATPSPANAPVGDQAEILRQAGLLRDPLRREEAANAQGPFDTSALKGPYNQAALGSPARGPVSTDPTQRTTPPPTQPDVQVASGADRTGGYPNRSRLAGLNSDMKLSDFNMPRSAQPYPDALSRDFGQRATRSPWMALVQAGLKMAQSTKPGVAGLAEGAESGVAYLDKQRGELRSEQQINQKAEELFRHAQTELNKYTRMTPYEQARIEQEKYQWQPGTGVDPESGQVVSGAYRLPTKPGEKPTFMPGVSITGRSGATATAMQKNIEYLVASGIAPNKEAAFNLVHQSISSPAVYARLVQAQEKILQGDHQWIKASTAERHAEAERIVKSMQSATGGSAVLPAATAPGDTPDSPLPNPPDGKFVPGKYYINPKTGKPDRWIG